MIKYLLDTNICIYLIRKNPPTIVQRFQALRKGEVAISAITWAELCCGIRKDGAGAVEALLSQPAGQRGRPQRQAALQPGPPPNPVLSGNIHTHSHPPPRRKHQPAL